MSWVISKEKLREIGNLVAKKLIPYCGSVYGVHEDNNEPAVFLGSGTFLKRNGKFFFLTAQHVVYCSDKYAHLFISRDNNKLMCPSQGGWVGYEVAESDLAILGCFEELYEDTEVKFLDITKIGEPFLADDALFFTQGFPDQLHISFPFMRQNQSVSLPIISTFKSIIKNKNGDEIMFAISYSHDVNPQGMSGSGVWNLNLHKVNNIKE